ncbi:Glu/Leu/Phe/Val dehydrogenase dimerization domain-containing protein [Streptomyces sp. ISL-94]|uniref:Glu/Leu/Phe/Val dehydrogenase dimerization domain-containing protein n=1 Tax=Streptomyces sp. ISL-94 TaxID=2819190 RepID=UPI002034BB04|nr:Glu/Leu/Phe/Val dehydrogenase dimerization domain-containing protein [Streptomyces sp. ISL-94]
MVIGHDGDYDSDHGAQECGNQPPDTPFHSPPARLHRLLVLGGAPPRRGACSGGAEHGQGAVDLGETSGIGLVYGDTEAGEQNVIVCSRHHVADALRLAAAMTEKNALAGLEHGGAKAVVALPTAARPARSARPCSTTSAT